MRTPLEEFKLQGPLFWGGVVTHPWVPTVVLRGATNLTFSVSNSSCHHQTQLERGWTKLCGKAWNPRYAEGSRKCRVQTTDGDCTVRPNPSAA